MSIETQTTYTKETLFKPISSVKESIAERIDRTARSIQKVETDARIAKTLRLRKARMEYEQTIVPSVAKKKRTRKPH
jgi:predicted nucleotidyltransferase